MFFDVFKALCEQKKISMTAAVVDMKLSRSAVTRWQEGAKPNSETMRKVAEYFGVTTNYLSGQMGIGNPKPVANSANAREIDTDYGFESIEPVKSDTRSLDLKIAFSLIRIFSPEITSEDIAKKLNMTIGIVEKALASNEFKIPMPGVEWCRAYHSLFSDTDVVKFVTQLGQIQDILVAESLKIATEKPSYVLFNYLHQHYSSVETVKTHFGYVPNVQQTAESYIAVAFKELGQQWAFHVYSFELNTQTVDMFVCLVNENLERIRIIRRSRYERVYMVINSELAKDEFEQCIKEEIKYGRIKARMNSKLWLLLFDKNTDEVLFDKPLVDFIDIDGDSFIDQET